MKQNATPFSVPIKIHIFPAIDLCFSLTLCRPYRIMQIIAYWRYPMYIDEKFKDAKPQDTIERIKSILKELDIELVEEWIDTGIEHCHGLHVHGAKGFPYANGKGVSPDFARGSAYGEFMERLQSGLFFYKFQSLENDPALLLHSFAPDAVYRSKQELLEDSEWMDPIVQAYGVSKEALADQCEMYAGSKQILMTPYYDYFGKKHVLLPAGFIEHIYSANGCCVGNTREEAWIHALSEIMERYCCIRITSEDRMVPIIPEDKLRDYKIVGEILDRIRTEGDYHVDVVDCSLGTGYPVIATRILNRKTHRYVVSIGADPIPEIAIQRTLTEAFQGRTLARLGQTGNGRILSHAGDIDICNNVLNQLETAQGAMNATFFTPNDLPCSQFPDHSGLSNRELVPIVLEHFRKMDCKVYIRNYSFLGFHCYKFIIPGFSESRGLRLNQKIQQYAIGELAAIGLKNMRKADQLSMNDVLMYHKMIRGINSREYYYPFIAGLPLAHGDHNVSAAVHYAYAAWRLKRYPEVKAYLKTAISYCMDEEKESYLRCILQYLSFEADGIKKEQSFGILKRFYQDTDLNRLNQSLETHGDVFSDLLMSCQLPFCDTCPHKDTCYYEEAKRVIGNTGKRYRAFVHGQAPENFSIE